MKLQTPQLVVNKSYMVIKEILVVVVVVFSFSSSSSSSSILYPTESNHHSIEMIYFRLTVPRSKNSPKYASTNPSSFLNTSAFVGQANTSACFRCRAEIVGTKKC